jgi:hypothetical protein
MCLGSTRSPPFCHTTYMPATNELLQEGRYGVGQQSSQSPQENVYGDSEDALDGDTLAELMRRNSHPFPMSDVLEWADQLLDGLNYHHTAAPPIIHKNIRPENLVLASNGKITLQGYDQDANNTVSDANLVYAPLEQVWGGLDSASQNAIINSIDERSERILKEPPDPRSDLYSLGATLYYLVTGQEPVSALERAIELLDGNLDPLKEPSKLDDKIPAEISDVIMKAMEIKRENRYDAAAIMRQVLKTAQLRAKDRLGFEAPEVETPRVEAPVSHVQHPAPAIPQPEVAVAAPLSPEEELLEISAPEISDAPDAPEDEILEADPLVLKGEDTFAPEAHSEHKAMAAKASASSDLGSYGNAEEEPRAGLSMPILAAGAVAVLLIVGAVFFFVFSGSGEKPPSFQSPVQTPPAKLAETQPATQTSSVPSAAPAAETPGTLEPATADSKADSKAAQQKTAQAAKKPTDAPAKTPAKEKKPVTVDDLINDN